MSLPVDQNDLWNKGISDEVNFWTNWFATKGGQWPHEYLERLDPEKPLQEYFFNFLPSSADISILDVGAGPLTMVGKKLAGHNLQITAVDPLAHLYDELMVTYNVIPPVRTELCAVENLSEKFKDKQFDVVHMVNALDHSCDPVGGITEMLHCVKKGSWLLLNHNSNEAEKENYVGFHQWNLCIENDEFVIWNKAKKSNINSLLKDKATVEVLSQGEWTSVAVRKL